MKPRWFARGDIDGFFGLFIDNLLQLMLIVGLCTTQCGLSMGFVVGRILPGAAISILVGNLFYAWQARRLMQRTGRSDVTALPYGINTVSLIAYVFLIMAPVWRDTHDETLVWQVGLFACLVSGVMETIGAFFGDWLRRNTPRAGLLSALAGVAITFIAMGFIFQMFAKPGLAVFPMLVILICYAARLKLPLGLPAGFVAAIAGTAIGWASWAFGADWFTPASKFAIEVNPPHPYFGDAVALLASSRGWQYMAVIFPMALINVVGSLQNLESAEAAGDRYETRPSLLVNGICSIVAAFFGSAFPTTIYIGHPGWKAMGARAGYSVINGVVITILCLIGGVTLVLGVVPLEAMLGILLWIGVIITAQAFQAVPGRHALAVAVGLIPAIAAWTLDIVLNSVRGAGNLSFTNLIGPLAQGGFHLDGVAALAKGFLLSSMILAAMIAYVIDRQFLRAAAWAGGAAVLSLTGLIHGYAVTPFAVLDRIIGQEGFDWRRAITFFCVYAAAAGLLMALDVYHRRSAAEQTAPEEADAQLTH